MDLLDKIFCFLFFVFLVVEIFPQEQSYISINGNINNSFSKRNIYNVTTTISLRDNNSAEILDSLICLYLNGDRIKIEYNYNDNLSLNYFTNADWFNGEWIISDKHTNTYSFDGNLESVLWEWFNTSLGEWIKVAKDVYNFDSLGNQITYLHQIYNGQEFINILKNENYFKGSNLVSSIHQKWENNIWVNNSKIINTFNADNLKVTALIQDWENNQWVNYQLNIYGYDENMNIISNLAKRWNNNNWLNFARGSFKYNSNNNCVLEIWEIAKNDTWENWFRIFYEYDDNNNLIHLFGEEWKNNQWVPENELLKVTNPDGITFGYFVKEIFLYYSKPTSVGSVKSIAKGFNLIQNYPNPFNPVTQIKYSIPQGEFVTIKVFDLLGREIALLVNEEKPAGEFTVSFDASNIASGIYFYTISAGSFNQTRKMILTK